MLLRIIIFLNNFLNQVPYSIFIERNIWRSTNGYDENMRLGYEDWEFNIRLGAKNIFGKRLPFLYFTILYAVLGCSFLNLVNIMPKFGII